VQTTVNPRAPPFEQSIPSFVFIKNIATAGSTNSSVSPKTVI
jgi:hypothetical protein